MLDGGLDRGTSTLVVGPAGAGKSVLCAQVAAAAARRGEPAIYFSFGEGIDLLVNRSDRLGMGMRDLAGAGRLELRQLDPTTVSPGEFTHLIRRAVEGRGARVVVIDGLNGYLNAMVEERMLPLLLHELLAYLAHRGVLTLLVMGQNGLIGASMPSPADVSYLADTVMLLRVQEIGGGLSRSLSMMKRRGGEIDTMVREYRIGGDGLRIGPVVGGMANVPVRDDRGALVEGEESR